ncbi:MAG: LemA family protein [Candidatus Cloacimonadota bacterium]|nr:MAG: LemA family protein [Candidatus Cloacimonadota bacterium]
MSKKTKTGCWLTIIIVILIVFGIFSYVKNSYNQMVTLEENVKAKWSQVENVYQRRYDLIPNLVNTVKGYAAHEKETFTAVTEARAKAGGMFNISEQVLNDPAMFQKFQQAQSTLGGALQRLMVVMEKYPELKANENFLALQDQLEGTENRIAVERKRFNEAAKDFNIYIKKFPRVILANMFGFREKPYFKSSEGAEKAPKVEF